MRDIGRDRQRSQANARKPRSSGLNRTDQSQRPPPKPSPAPAGLDGACRVPASTLMVILTWSGSDRASGRASSWVPWCWLRGSSEGDGILAPERPDTGITR